MNTILITGVRGFLGGALARILGARGWAVIGVGWRLPDRRFGALLDEVRPALCVHCAGPASVANSFVDPVKDFADGPGLVFDLLTQIRDRSPHTRFLFLSSAAVYGEPAILPVAEDHRCLPVSPYGRHKLRAEEICREFAESDQLATASVRIFSAYGPELRRQVIWDVCQKILSEPEVVLQGTGAESRDFIHAGDIARGIETTASHGAFNGEVYNLASGRETTIAELAERLAPLLGIDVRVRFDGVLPPGTPRNWCADMRRLQSLGFTPGVALEDGLAEVVRSLRGEVPSLAA